MNTLLVITVTSITLLVGLGFQALLQIGFCNSIFDFPNYGTVSWIAQALWVIFLLSLGIIAGVSIAKDPSWKKNIGY